MHDHHGVGVDDSDGGGGRCSGMCACVYECMLWWETVRPLCGYHGYCINHRSPASVPSTGIKSL